MKALVKKLWTEPAAFIAALAGTLNVVQVLVIDSPRWSAVIVAVSIALAGQQTRARVTPAA